ncbi:MAG: DUF262 domain-containing HNH endonuclease family protein [candidate division Zixibacteria bacterium]|nr:DUF262 domain-containing HNH endonuclease family protein [candidate division Zixibacteria bacterium]
MPEDTSGIFKPDAKNIEKIFSDADSYYLIPDYQRPYSWEDEQIEQLWDDLFSAMESEDASYFLGPMILIKTKDGHFEVVDGQQRLTTLTILFCVIRDLYKDELEKIDKALTNKIQNAIKSMVDEKPRLKLITQLHYQNKFEDEILNGVRFSTTNLTKKKRKEEKFINAASIFKQKFEELKVKSGIEGIKNLTNYLLKNVEMITITCSKQDYAIKLFQVINTRGLDLSPADLIKSYLYGKLSYNIEIEQEKFISTWREVETLSKQMDEPITNLLTYYEYYLLAQNPKRSLYEELTDKFKGQDSNQIIYEFKKFVDSFNEVYKMESKLIFSFWYLPNQVFWKAILTTAKYKQFHDFEGLSKELRKVYYSYWVAGYTTSKIKQLSFNLIGWIKGKKTLDDIKKETENKMKEDNVIKRMGENLQNDAYGESWLKPILSLIEYNQTDDSKISFIDLDKKVHADHVLPTGWKSESVWKAKWTEDEANNWLDTIGNLTLLSGKKNIAQQNDPPKKKAEMYKKGHGGTTAFEISQDIIPQLEKVDWLEENVKERQKWMIEQSEEIFEIKL